MNLSEFDLIDKYFTTIMQRDDVVLGCGDDAAITRVTADIDLIEASASTCSAPMGADTATGLTDKCLAQLAQQGASPAWMTLALTMPAVDEAWLKEFSGALLAWGAQHNVQLIGGDTTRGPLCISIKVIGIR
ncbi:MAG: hypothetical protein BMS9Abin26_1442 [Gammaproteobacteria bacterium]|nr:MAG: hypothetical protein BMS9Abin26_1442 [Gammaproteobacteria bacterium]